MHPNKKPYHSLLAKYFTDKPLYLDKKNNDKPNIRKLVEQPWQQTKAKMWNVIEATLCDLQFIEAKCSTKMIYDLINDYERLGIGQVKPRPPIKTAWIYKNKMGMYCPFCLAWNKIVRKHLGRIISCPACKQKLKLNPFIIRSRWHPLESQRSIIKIEAEKNAQLSQTISEFAYFVKKHSHIINELPELTFQQAANEPDHSAPASKAQAIYSKGIEKRPWLQWINKPQHVNPAIITLNGHEKSVKTCVYSPDGRYILSGSWDKTLKIWDAVNGKELFTLRGHSIYITCCAYSPDGRYIVSGAGYDGPGELKVWDVEGCKELTNLGHSLRAIECCAFSPYGKRIVSGGMDHDLRIWDVEKGTQIATLIGHTSTVLSCAFSPDGQWIVSGSVDNNLKIWNAYTFQEVATLVGHSNAVRACQYSPDGKRIVSGAGYIDKPGDVKVWDVETYVELYSLVGHMEAINTCAYSPDGKKIVTGSEDAVLKVWNAETGVEIANLMGHGVDVNCCAFSPGGDRIISASSDHTIRVWDTELGSLPNMKSKRLEICTFLPDNKKFITVSKDSILKLWDTKTGKKLSLLSGHEDKITHLANSLQSKRIVSASKDKTLKLWDQIKGTEIATLIGHIDWVNTCAYSPDGCQIVSGSSDKTLRLWNGKTGQPITILYGHTTGVSCCEYDIDGRRIISTAGNELKFWDVVTGEIVNSVKTDIAVSNFFLSPTGERILLLSYNHGPWGALPPIVELYDAKSGKLIKKLSGTLQFGNNFPFSPDGRFIWTIKKTGGFFESCAITGRLIRTMSADEIRTGCTYSPDGRLIVSSLIVWDAVAGERLANIILNVSPYISTVSEHEGEYWIATGDRYGQVNILNLRNIKCAPPIVTLVYLFKLDSNQWSDQPSTQCKWCGKRFQVNNKILDIIYSINRENRIDSNASPCQELNDKAWEEPLLLSECPKCHRPLKFNLFIMDNRGIKGEDLKM